MARRLTRDENAAATRRRLVRAARKVFLERGFHGASLDAVVDEAGFTKGAVYSQFASKGDLLAATIEEINRDRTASVEAALAEAQSVDELVELLKAWFRDQRARIQDARFSLTLVEFWTWAGRDPAMRKRVGELHERMIGDLAAVVDAAAARCGGELPYPSVELVRLIAGLARGIALERHISPGAVDDAAIDWMFDSILPASRAPAATTVG